ncbi:hypothetical protein ACIA5G_46125 [Amycolatopsis sp. NPDC051758]|uniref:hypothetical protein n=1 Tax=Amycolatopsis sp. NPDC051758 TaxID=3363935 RepID=UPI0037894C3D
MDQVVPEDERPDGRVSTPETRQLREATRSLRLHLDYLPAVFHWNGAADLFFAELAWPFARQRYACCDSLLGAGFGGTVVGAMARSLLVDALRWQWIGAAPRKRLPSLLGWMLEERSRICWTLDQHDASCPILPRWFAPLIGVTDLTGSSPEWLHAPTVPSDDELLDLFLAEPVTPPADPTIDDTTPRGLLTTARSLLHVAGLRGAVLVLGHAGHGNLLGALSSFTEDGTPGHDLRADHEALFMHVAAVGVTTTLLGVWAAAPESWPPEIDDAYLLRTVELTKAVVAAATAIHGLGTPKSVAGGSKKRRPRSNDAVLHPGAILRNEDLLPDVNPLLGRVISAAELYTQYAQSWSPSLGPSDTQPRLASILTHGLATSNLTAVMSTYDQDGGNMIAVFAARMLLEEAARYAWMTSISTEEEFMDRSKRYFDEFRFRRRKAIEAFTGNGVDRANAEKLFEFPKNIKISTPMDTTTKGRQPLPSMATLLREMGADYPETAWLDIAYSLLSQVTHSTPIGHLHTVTLDDGTLRAGTITKEFLGLTLDAACLGSAHLLGWSSVLLTAGREDARIYKRMLLQKAYHVHDAARMLHGLD